MTPRLEAATIYMRFLLLIVSSSIGLFGYFTVAAIVIIHIYNLHSFGIPMMPSTEYPEYQNFKDLLFRAPWWTMKERPYRLTYDRVRIKSEGRRGTR
jgi:spore germination protein KA